MRWVILLFGFLFLFSFVSAQSETRVDFIVSDTQEPVNVYSGTGFFDLAWTYLLIVLVVFFAIFALVKFNKKRVNKKTKKLSKRKLKRKR